MVERVHTVLHAEGTVRLITVVKLETRIDKVPTLAGKRLDGGSPGGRRLVPPGPSGRGRELPLGFEPVVPVGAHGPAPRQPEVVGVERNRLGGGRPVLFPGVEGRRHATRLDRLRLGRAAGIGGILFSPVGEEVRVARFLVDGLLDMFDPSLPGRPERALGLGSNLHAGPAFHSPGRGLVRLDTAAAAEPSGGA